MHYGYLLLGVMREVNAPYRKRGKEQEMKVRVAEMRALVVEAESMVPPAAHAGCGYFEGSC